MRVTARLAAAVFAAALALISAPVAEAAAPGAITEFGIPTPEGAPYGIAPGPDGNLWFTENKKDQIGRITPSGEVSEFAIPTPASKPTGITTGPDGNVWFVEYGANKIGRITPAGAVTEFEVPTPNSKPFRITAGPDGNLWFAEERAGRIGRITPSGTFAEFPVPTAESKPTGIAWGQDGNLWFTESAAGADKIGRISPTGTFAEFPIPTAGAELEDIVPGPDGNLWFAERSKDQVGRITPMGVVTEFPVPTAKGAPEWITAAPDGNLYFSEFDGNKLARITPAGAITEVEVPTAGSSPAGIVPGSDGNLWFAETGAGRIGRLGAGAPEALASAPAIAGGGQQGAAQTCSVGWSTWASLAPLPNFFGFDGYRWHLDGTLVATSQSYTPTVANIGHKLACSATVTYPLPLFVSAVATSVPLTVVVPPTPTITRLRQSAKTWRAGRALAHSSRKHRPPIGTTISFTLNVQASVSFTFTQGRPGRRMGHRCVVKNRRNARRRACARLVTVGAFALAAHAGPNKVVFQGRFSRSARLGSGRYTLVIVATNTAGLRSAPAYLHFAVVR